MVTSYRDCLKDKTPNGRTDLYIRLMKANGFRPFIVDASQVSTKKKNVSLESARDMALQLQALLQQQEHPPLSDSSLPLDSSSSSSRQEGGNKG